MVTGATMPRPKAYSYIRFSSAPQEKGDSVRRQREKSERYATAHDLDLDDSLNLRDLGLSAFDGSNIEKGALGAFLLMVKDGKIAKGSYLLVESLDRMSRAQVMQALAVFTQIINAGIVIVTVEDEMMYSAEKLANDPMPLIMSIMVMIRAHEESLKKSIRVKDAWAEKRRRVHERKLTRTCPSWMELSTDRQSFRLIPERVATVHRILQMQRDGIGQATIVRTFNQESVPLIQTRVKTESWHTSTIQKIITNPALYGAYQPTIGVGGKKRIPYGEPIDDYYPPIITQDEFILQQQARQDRATRGRGAKGVAFTNIFSGLLRCGCCGGTMTVGGHTTKKYGNKRYIVCSNAKRGMGCHFVMWTYHLFERTILTYCEGLDFADLLDEGGDSKDLATKQLIVVETIRARRSDQRDRLDRLLVAIENGDAPAAIIERIRESEQKLQQLDKELQIEDRKHTELMLLRQDAENIKASIVDLFHQLSSRSGDELYSLRAKVATQIKRVVAKIEVFPGGYVMSKEEWAEFTKGMSKRDIKREQLEKLITPDKNARFALIWGFNGRYFPTYSVGDAHFKGMTQKAELLQQLGVSH